MKRNLSLLSIIALLTLSSCITFFKVVNKTNIKKGSSIAVISGINNEANLSMAIFLTEALKKNSTFKVMSQKKIARKLPFYPIRIKGPWKYAYVNIVPDYKKTNIELLRAIQKRLKVKYLYVVWIPCINQISDEKTKIESLHTIIQLFEFPSAKEIGNGKFEVQKITSSGPVITFGYKMPKTKKEAMKRFSDGAAKELARKLNMGKK